MKKLDVLNVLSKARDLDVASIARRLHGKPAATSMMLLRLCRHGLVFREIDHGLFVYNLTPKGTARRVYLNAREPERRG